MVAGSARVLGQLDQFELRRGSPGYGELSRVYLDLPRRTEICLIRYFIWRGVGAEDREFLRTWGGGKTRLCNGGTQLIVR